MFRTTSKHGDAKGSSSLSGLARTLGTRNTIAGYAIWKRIRCRDHRTNIVMDFSTNCSRYNCILGFSKATCPQMSPFHLAISGSQYVPLGWQPCILQVQIIRRPNRMAAARALQTYFGCPLSAGRQVSCHSCLRGASPMGGSLVGVQVCSNGAVHTPDSSNT
jgi:hypothetical protein